MLHAKNYPSRWRFLRSFLTASKPSRRSITAAKTREKEKQEGQKKIPKTFDFCTCPSHNALKRDASGKKGKLLCCKRIFDWVKGNLVEIQPKNRQNVQKTHFLQKVPGVNGLKLKIIINLGELVWKMAKKAKNLDNSLPESSICITGIKWHEAMCQVILNHILKNTEKNKWEFSNFLA